MPASIIKNEASDSEQAIALSDKIGSVIDADIRMRYNLFPDPGFASGNINDTVSFIEARFYPLGKGGYIVRLITDRGTFKAQNTGANAVAILQDYFVCYDSIVYFNNKKSFEKKWGIVDYDILGLPITMEEVERLTKANPRLKYGGLAAMIAGAALGGFTGFAIATWTNMLGGCLGGTGAGDTVSASVLKPTLTCAGLGAVPGTGMIITAELLRKKYDNAIEYIKQRRLPCLVKKR